MFNKCNKLTSFVILTVSIFMFLFSCKGADGLDGIDGLDGDAYFALTWTAVNSYGDNNNDIPSNIVKDTYYKTRAGTFNFQYTSWDNSKWSGTYTLKIRVGTPGTPGTSGGMFWKKGENGQDGADGANLYFKLGLWSTGPRIYTYNSPLVQTRIPAREMGKINRKMPDSQNQNDACLKNVKAFSGYQESNGDVKTQVLSSGRYQVILRYQKLKQ